MFPPFFKDFGRYIEVDNTGFGIDHDLVAIFNQSDWSAFGRFGADMANAEAARCAREASIGDERNLLAHALPI